MSEPSQKDVQPPDDRRGATASKPEKREHDTTMIRAVFHGPYSVLDYLVRFFLPTLIGNIVGGILMVAVINYAQVAYSDSNHAS
ncbi:hypothetical protein [Salinisphaera sp.]|uniref:hypothetical protein n=1 Tax=Salinisphaera sp. TaxID=1914330 RepID=UPI002D7843BE|nr:hypothetical protein [Salinisphaera sp.]HET7314196.1 hypothetical protein [Salinisphaera sp.]